MVSPVFIPFSKKHNMKFKKGVCFGDLCGYAATLSDGLGTKKMVITSYLNNFDREGFIKELRDEIGVQTNYDVIDYRLASDKIIFTFKDKIGFMKIFYKFVDVIIKVLDKYNVSKSNICPFCGEELSNENSEWWLIDNCAFHIHKNCANIEFEKRKVDTETKIADAGGSYVSGFIGATLGATLAGTFCAIVSGISLLVSAAMGYMISSLSFFGYKRLNGKRGKYILPIIIVAVFYGCLVSSFGSLLFTIIINLFKSPYGKNISLSEMLSLYSYVYSQRSVVVIGIFAITLYFALFSMFFVFISIKEYSISVNMKKL